MTTQQISQQDFNALTKNHSLIREVSELEKKRTGEDRRTSLCALCPLHTPYYDIFTLKQHNIFHPKSE